MLNQELPTETYEAANIDCWERERGRVQIR